MVRVALALIEKDGKILLGKRITEPWKGFLALAGDSYEEDAKKSLKKIIKGDFGMEIEVGNSLGFVEEGVEIFECKVMKDEFNPVDTHEGSKFYRINELKKLKIAPPTKEALIEYFGL